MPITDNAKITIPVKATVLLDPQMIADTIISALDGDYGSAHYWCSPDWEGDEKAFQDAFAPPPGEEKDPMLFRAAFYANEHDHTVTFHHDDPDSTDDGDYSKTTVLTRAMAIRGVEIMAEKFPRHFADMMNENGDATTGDVLLQCMLLGDIVYG